LRLRYNELCFTRRTSGVSSFKKMIKVLFVLGLVAAASGFASPPVALALGLAFGLGFRHPYNKGSKKLSKYLLQASVVGLGFGMNLQQVIHAGRSGFVYTLLSISFAMIVGMSLGAMLKVPRTSAFLISTGTAICGGSAIAAVGPISDATEEQMAVSLGTIFVLNSIALLIFPVIGAALKMTQQQFGLWAALAIHDTSSVVGAAAKYGAIALAVGTTVKLARALWIVPMSVGTAVVKGSKAKIYWPWFIALFCMAAVFNTYLPAGAHEYHLLSNLGKIGLTVTLYLIGSGISIATLKQVGYRPLLQGVVLWLLVSIGSLWLIRIGWISL
jgi:uncharacterized integral membrane protein (TIGR00698 family)